jgi:hypothetical protein
MKSVKPEVIKKQFEGWSSYYSDNNNSGGDAIDFIMASKQWDDNVASSRAARNQESLVFNLIIKHLRRIHSQMCEIEFNTTIWPANSESTERVEEIYAYRLIINSIMTHCNALKKYADAGEKCINYGYSFIEINFGYENEATTNLEPKIILHKDPCVAFWDKSALTSTKIDGEFAGFCRKLTKDELIKSYPSLKDEGWIKDKENKVYDYWFRDYKDHDYLLLKTGVYKREDLLNNFEKQNVQRGAPKETRKVCEIYFQRCTEKKILEGPRKFPTSDLPIIYHHGNTEWHPEKGEITIPYGNNLKDAQKLHNYLMSQIASQSKNCHGDKYLFSNSNVTTTDQLENARNINKRDGGFTFGGDVNSIRREQPANISPTLIEAASVTKQLVDDINGAMIDSQNAQQTIISGEAIDKVTKNLEIINAFFMKRHYEFVNDCSKIVKQMIPNLYTQERTLLVQDRDGTQKAIVINQDAKTGTLINNIKDIENSYHYDIKAGPSTTMQKDTTIKYLMEVYNTLPQNPFFAATAHIFFRNLDTKDAQELERIAVAMGDPLLIKYSEGRMSLDDFQQAKQQQQQQQEQQQQQMQQQQVMNDPQVLTAKAMADAEHRKASAIEANAETKRMEAIADAQDKQNQFKLQMAQLLMENGLEGKRQELEQLRTGIQANQQFIDMQREHMKNDGQ